MIAIIYAASFIISFLRVYFMIPPLKKLAFRIDFLDKPRKGVERKIHREPIPLTASYAIFAGIFITYLLLTGDLSLQTAAIIGGAFILLIVGTVDDWYKTRGKDFRVLPKLLLQVSAAVIVYASGIEFAGFYNPFSEQYVLLPEWLQFTLTVLWIFGVTTVINFSDGMDGLAGTLTAISAGTLFVVALTKGQELSAVLAIVLVGVALAYLRYNKPPAKIFMGDAGATILGFMLSVIALEGVYKQATVLSLFIPVLALGVPIFDNLFVVVRRFLNGKPIYEADASQAHYRLLRSGLNPKQVIAFLSLISLCLSLSSIILLLVQS